MPGSTTTYKVDIVYDLKGSAAGGLKGLSNQARQATHSMGGLKSMLALVGGGLIFHAGKKLFVDFNNEVQKLKIGLATVTAMNFHQPFELASKAADQMFDHFQKMAVESPNTTKDFVEMANMISSSVLQSGMGLKQLESMTKGAVTAANALGAQPDLMAREVQRMLAGTVIQRDRFAKQMLAGIGITDYKAFNKKTAAQRADLTMQAFNSPAIQDAAKAYATSFQGVTSTLKDNIEIAFGKVGMPLVKQLTAEVASWNDWITANPTKVAEISERISNGLKEAFTIVKDIGTSVLPILKDVMGVIADVMSFMANHKDVIEGVVKGLLVFKGVSMAKGLFGGLGGGAGGLFGELSAGFGKLKEAFGPTTTGLEALSTGLSGLVGVAGPIAIFGGALAALAGFIFHETEDEKRAKMLKDSQIKSASEYQTAKGKYKDYLESHPLTGLTNPSEEGLKLKTGLEGYEKDIKQKLLDAGILLKEQIDETHVRYRLANTGAGEMGMSASSAGGLHAAFDPTADIQLRQAAIELLKTKVELDNIIRNGRDDMPAGAGLMNAGDIGKVRGFFEEEEARAGGPAALFGMTPPKPANVNVTINKIEVYSDDADRFVAQAVNSFEEVVRNPTMAHDIIRGAF